MSRAKTIGLDALTSISGASGKTSKEDGKTIGVLTLDTAAGNVEMTLADFDAIYRGFVTCWPAVKPLKEKVIAATREETKAAKDKEREQAKADKEKQKAEAKAKREQEIADRKAAKEKEKADAKAKRDQEAKDRAEKKKKEDMEKAKKAADEKAKKDKEAAKAKGSKK